MFRPMHRGIAGAIIISLMAACQQAPSATVPSDPTVPTRTVEHAMGTSEVPISPERVVVIDTAPLDAALALGIQPVGTIVYGNFPAYLEEAAGNITIVGEGNQPNLETILSLNPDLILGTKIGVSRSLYRQLSQIAPTVLTKGSGRSGEWQENFQLYAEALGQPEQAEQLLQSYQQRVQQFQAVLGQPQALEISVLSTYSNRIGTYTTGSFPGSVLEDIGFARTRAQDVKWRYVVEFSREAVDKLDGDHVFLIYSPHIPGGVSKNDFVVDPIWSQLQAVQQDRVCEVTGEVWAAGRSILAANQILIDVERCLDRAQALTQKNSNQQNSVGHHHHRQHRSDSLLRQDRNVDIIANHYHDELTAPDSARHSFWEPPAQPPAFVSGRQISGLHRPGRE